MRLDTFLFQIQEEFFKQRGKNLKEVKMGSLAFDDFQATSPYYFAPTPHLAMRSITIHNPVGSLFIEETTSSQNMIFVYWDSHDYNALTLTDILYDRCDKPAEIVKNLPATIAAQKQTLPHSYPYNVTTNVYTPPPPPPTNPSYWNPYLSGFDSGATLKTPEASKPTSCFHDVKEYFGLNQRDWYCTKCNQKWDKKP